MDEGRMRAQGAPKTWAERCEELAARGIDPQGQLAEEIRLATAHERAAWRKAVVAGLLLGADGPSDCAGAGEDAQRGAALLALADKVGLGGCRGLTGDASARIPQLKSLPGKCAQSGPAWTAEVERWAERAQGYYLRPVVGYDDNSLHVGIALLAPGEVLDLRGATRRAFVGLAGLPDLPEIANPTAGESLPAAHIRAIALNAGLELALGEGRIPHARLAPEDLPIWAAIAEVCALMGEDGPAYSGIWRTSDLSRADRIWPLTLERVQHLLHDHKPAGEVPAPDDDGLDG